MDLSPILEPRSVAVVGASSNPAAFGSLAICNLQRWGFAGSIHPVHTSAQEILGLRCAPTLRSLDEVPDLCVIALRSELVPDVVRDCADLGVRAVTVVGSGFAEAGTEVGRARQADIVAASRAAGMLLLGPNTLGAASFRGRVVSAASANIPDDVRPGTVGIVSQSGGLGTTILAAAARQGTGVDGFVAVGNEAGVGIADAIEHFAARGASAVLCYLETIRDVAAFRAAAMAAAHADVPVIVLKGGTNPAGQAITMSHTASLAGSTRVLDAALADWGVHRVSSIDALVAAGALHERFGRSPGRRLGVLGIGGGNSALLADALDADGLDLAAIAPGTADQIRSTLPDSNAANPLDPGGWFLGKGGDLLTKALSDFVADVGIDVMVYGMVPLSPQREPVYLEGIAGSAASTTKPGICLSGHTPMTSARAAAFEDAGILELSCTASATEAIRVWQRWSEQEPVQPASTEPTIDAPESAAATLAPYLARIEAGGTATLLEHEAMEVLSAGGLSFAGTEVVATPQEAVDAATALGFPVVVKALAVGLAHRAQHGAVAVGLGSADEVVAACERVVANARRVVGDEVDVRLLVQAQSAAGTEMIVGVQRDPVFGPVVVVGLGGVWSETFDDVAFLHAPFTADRALRAVTSLRSGPQLERLTRSGSFDAPAFCDLVAQVGLAVQRLGDAVESVDLNPVIVRSQGCSLVDALVVLRGRR